MRDPTGGSGWWGFLDEQPEIVEEIDEEELIVQEVTQECFFNVGVTERTGKVLKRDCCSCLWMGKRNTLSKLLCNQSQEH